MASAINISLMLAGLTLLASCADKSKKFDGPKADKGAVQGSGSSNPGNPGDPGTPVINTSIDNRSIEQVLCEEGPKVIGAAKKADFSEQFKLVCDGSNTTALFKESILQAYQGNGEPVLKLAKYTSDANFVTNISIIYALKAPLANPSMFADLKPHDIFAAGVKAPNSELHINVESRKTFPGKASVEQILLNYDMNLAAGASIYDKRHTEFNTYLLVENNRDIAVSTEHLLDADTNEYYHVAQGLTIGLKGENNQSYLVFVSTLIVKNRIQPERIRDTVLSLNTVVAKMLQQHILSQSAK